MRTQGEGIAVLEHHDDEVLVGMDPSDADLARRLQHVLYEIAGTRITEGQAVACVRRLMRVD